MAELKSLKCPVLAFCQRILVLVFCGRNRLNNNISAACKMELVLYIAGAITGHFRFCCRHLRLVSQSFIVDSLVYC